MGSRKRSRLERFANIRCAMDQLLGEKSFDKVKTQEVAEFAGAGKATLFRYTRTKRELLLLVFSDRMKRRKYKRVTCAA